MLEVVDKSAVVTGANTYLGRHLVALLVTQGWGVLAIRQPPEPSLQLGVTTAIANVAHAVSLNGLFDGYSVVFHLVEVAPGQGNRSAMVEVNVNGARNVAIAAGESGCLMVHATPVIAIGPTPSHGCFDESYLAYSRYGETHYEQTRRTGHRLVTMSGHAGTSVRLAFTAGMYGGVDGDQEPMSYTHLMRQFATRHLPAFCPSDLVASLVHVDDAAAGLIAIAERGVDDDRYILSESTLTLGELVTKVALLTDHSPPPLLLPRIAEAPFYQAAKWLARVHPETDGTHAVRRLTRHNHYAYTGDKARQQLGWEPRTLAQGIDEILGDLRGEMVATDHNNRHRVGTSSAHVQSE